MSTTTWKLSHVASKSMTAATYIAKSPWERNRSLLATSVVPEERKRRLKEMNKKEKSKWYYRHVITATDGGRALASVTSMMMCQLFSFSSLDDALKQFRQTEAQREHRHPRHLQSPCWERLTYRRQQFIPTFPQHSHLTVRRQFIMSSGCEWIIKTGGK